jgi:hypothetical protein
MELDSSLEGRLALLERQLDDLRCENAKELFEREIQAGVERELEKGKERRRRHLRDVAAVLGGLSGVAVMAEVAWRVFG